MLPSVANESKDIGESALENPLPWDTIPSAKYDHFNLVEPYLPELRNAPPSASRPTRSSPTCARTSNCSRSARRTRRFRSNEKQRLKEQDEAEARQKARDKERLARPEPPEKVYEMTLKQADQPGLPPPVAKTNAALAKLSVRVGAGAPGASTNSAAAAAPSGDKLDERMPRSRPRRMSRCWKPSTSWWITFRSCRKAIW